MRTNKIIIQKSVKPNSDNVNTELQWFCDSLGLFGTRDKNKSCFRMFVVLLKNLQRDNGLTSDELALRVGLSRGTVVHHLHKLIGSGLVVQRQSRYMIRVENLSELVNEVERDIARALNDLRDVAEEIDDRLRL